jgi:hypothetical protein
MGGGCLGIGLWCDRLRRVAFVFEFEYPGELSKTFKATPSSYWYFPYGVFGRKK